MATITRAGEESSATGIRRKALLLCGILAPLLFLVTDLLANAVWQEYNPVTQSISELSAPGAPTRALAVPLIVLYYVLIAAFGLGVWGAAGQTRALRITAGLIAGNGILGLAALFFPMYPSEPAGILPNILNTVILGLSTLSILLAIASGVFSFRDWFRWYSLGTLLAFVVLTLVGIWIAPGIDTGGPRIGVQERTMVYGCLLWVMVLAVLLLQWAKEIKGEAIQD